MNILLTNDDGFDAEGIMAIRTALEKNHNVYVVAPEKNQSKYKNNFVNVLHL